MAYFPFLSHEYPLRFAHRGSCQLWPENTLVAFQGAVDNGCLYIETDLQITRDGVLVTFHDDRLERLTDGRGYLKDWLWKDLKQLDAAYHFDPANNFPWRNKGIGIPSLEEAMEAFPGTLFNLDLKVPFIEEAVAGLIAKYRWQERVLVASLWDSRIRKCRVLLNKEVASSTGWWESTRLLISANFRGKVISSAQAMQLPVRKGPIKIINEKLITSAHIGGLQVHGWIVNDPEEMAKLLQAGIDGIVTDRIDLLNQVISEIKP